MTILLSEFVEAFEDVILIDNKRKSITTIKNGIVKGYGKAYYNKMFLAVDLGEPE